MPVSFNIPIRAKLVIIVLVFAILPMLVLTLVWYNTAVVRIAGVVRHGLDSRAREISHQLKQLNSPPTTATLEAAIGPRTTALTAKFVPAGIVRSDREVVVLDRNGVVLYGANPDWQGNSYAEALPPPLADIIRQLEAGVSSQTNVLRGAERDRYFLFGEYWLILLHRDASPLSIIVMERDLGRGQMDSAALIVLIISFLLAVVATLLVYLIISGTTDSIQRVTRGAKAIAAGKLETNITVRTNDETRVLADAFNRMSARLRGMIARESEQKQFESFARLSAVLTHDLKNAILSLSFLVTNMERKFDREGFKEDAMRTLSDSVGNLKNMVSKLSDPRPLSTDERKVEDLSPLVERVLSRTAEAWGERYGVVTELSQTAPAIVNSTSFERVIENLVINSLEAMPEGGRLTVKTAVDATHAIVTVADTGKGMSQDFISTKLFHPFATTKRKGVGLGLFACREIIEQHKGRIEVTSEEGVGTVFRVFLPLAAAESNLTAGEPVVGD